MPTPRTKLGDWGEAQAAEFLREKGWLIFATKYRCRWGEVDIVAQDREQLVFVEVRTKRSTNFGTPEESLSSAKMRRLTRTCQDYLQNQLGHGAESPADWRIDLISVYAGKGFTSERISHIENAVHEAT